MERKPLKRKAIDDPLKDRKPYYAPEFVDVTSQVSPIPAYKIICPHCANVVNPGFPIEPLYPLEYVKELLYLPDHKMINTLRALRFAQKRYVRVDGGIRKMRLLTLSEVREIYRHALVFTDDRGKRLRPDDAT